MKKLTLIIFNTLLAVALLVTVFGSTGVVSVGAQGLDAPPPQSNSAIYDGDVKDNPINQWIQFGLNVLTVVIIAGSAVMIAIAGIQYTTSRDNSQAVQAAKDKLWNITLGLLFYLFLYAFAQWLVPGGIF